MNKKNNSILDMLTTKNIKYFIYIIIIAFLVAINIRIFSLRRPKAEKIENNIVEENRLPDNVIREQNRNATIEEAYKLGNIERIERYLGEYVGFLKTGKLEEAYAKLNQGYKEKYFPDFNTYKEYITTNYPKDILITYGTETQKGELWEVEINFSDRSDSSFNGFTQRYVVRENGAYDYTISFQK